MASLLRITLPLGIISLIVSIIVKINGELFVSDDYNEVSSELIGNLLVFMEVMLIGALIAITLWTVIGRFRRSMYLSEGYLTHTIPVNTHTLLICKLICGTASVILTFLFVNISIIIMVYDNDTISVSEIMSSIISNPDYKQDYSTWTVIAAITIAELYSLMKTVSFLALVFFCITLGHTAKKHKIAMSIVWYFVFSSIVSVVENFIGILLNNLGIDYYGGILRIFLTPFDSIYEEMTSNGFMCLTYVLFTIVSIMICNHIIKNNLNLE